jgi:group I intron endonuclease
LRANLKGIYAIENTLTGKIYVGLSKDITRRWDGHFKMLCSRSHHSFELQSDWDELGIKHFSFRILEICEEDQLGDREKFWIHKYDAENSGYNMTNIQAPPEYLLEENKRLKAEIELLKSEKRTTERVINDGIQDEKQQREEQERQKEEEKKKQEDKQLKRQEENRRKARKKKKLEDELYEKALTIILHAGYASVSLLQRRMTIGYSNAVRLIDRLEVEGIIGAYNGSKPRQVLIKEIELIDILSNES